MIAKYFSRLVMTLAALVILGACSNDKNDEPSVNPQPTPTPTPAPTGEGNQTVIYEANPLYFASSECFNAIANRLGDIKAMGTDILWVMPINTLGEKNAFGSPYCIKDYYAINPKYGDMAKFKDLVAKTHSQGMRLIIDWVANHTAWDNPWVTEHPDWYKRNAQGQIVSPSGWSDVADLNYDNADLRKAMKDAMLYWVREGGVDGFRCDYAEGVPGEFWTDVIKEIRKVKSDAFMLAEASSFQMYDYGFDMIYDWGYCTDLQNYFLGKSAFSKLVSQSDATIAKLPKGKEILRYVVNHDVISEKSPVQLYGSNEAIVPAYVLTAFLGQVPLLYSGMEAGFTGVTPFIGAKPLTWSKDLEKTYDAIAKAYKATSVARGGAMTTYASGDAAVFALRNGNKSVLVMVNPTKSAVSVKTPMNYYGTEMTDQITGSKSKLGASVSLKAYGYKIFAD